MLSISPLVDLGAITQHVVMSWSRMESSRSESKQSNETIQVFTYVSFLLK